MAAHTICPVIGVPLDAGALKGMDALLSTAMMPGGVPVACVAIGSPGAKNAAILSAQILALSDSDIHNKLQAAREQQVEMVMAKNENLQQALSSAES